MTGSVYKRCRSCGRHMGKARKCSGCGSTQATWAYRVFTGKNAKGRWVEQRRTGFETQGQAQRALTEVVSALNGGTFVPPRKLTVREYLVDEWLPATGPPRVRPSTWEDRRSNLEHHVVAWIGSVRLQDLNPAHINRLYSDLMSEGRVSGEGGLSATSVRRVHAMLRKALNDAVRWGYVQRNVAELADPPPARLAQASRRRSMRTWNAEELRRFLAHTRGTVHHAMWVVAATTGLRRSELAGISWDTLDLDARLLTVRGTVVKDQDGDYVLTDEQKTTGSARTIQLDRPTVEVLRETRAANDAMREQVGALWREHGLVFPRSDGRWWSPPAITKAFARAVRSAKVPRIRLHDLRHTHATLLLKAGVNPKVVSERLGHSSVAFTLDTYAHVVPGMQEQAADLFGELLFDPTETDDEDAQDPEGDDQ